MTRTERTRHLSVARNGYALNAQVIAPPMPDSAWVVFGNSLVTDMTIWDAQVDALAGRFGILRYDQAGHGRSAVPPTAPDFNELDFDDLGADLLAVMDAADVDTAIYVGLSMGVPTGLAAHAAQPGRFSALVFSDGQCRTAPGGGAAWAERIAAAQASGMAEFAKATAGRWLTATAGPDLRDRLTAMIAATPFEGFRLCATALMHYDYADQLAQIAVPTLLIAGEMDGAMPTSMANMLQPKIAGAHMVVIPDAGHVPCLEQPTRFNAALDGFLSGAGISADRTTQSPVT